MPDLPPTPLAPPTLGPKVASPPLRHAPPPGAIAGGGINAPRPGTSDGRSAPPVGAVSNVPPESMLRSAIALHPDSQEAEAKVNNAIIMSSLFGINPMEAYELHDELAMSINNGEKMGARDLLGFLKEGLDIGWMQEQRGELGYKYILGDDSPETLKKIGELNNKIQLLSENKQDKAWVLDAIYEAAKIAPQIFLGVREGTIKGGILGAGFAGVAALAGLALEAVPALGQAAHGTSVAVAGGTGFAVGFAEGTLEHIMRQESGNSFIELLDITDADGNHISINMARAGAAGIGILNGIIESFQIASIPGVSEGLNSILKTSFGKTVKSLTSKGVFKNILVRGVARHGINATTEALQEVVQESVQFSMSEFLKHVENDVKDTKFEKDWQNYLPRMWETFETSFKGFMALGVPGSVINTTKAAILERSGKIEQLRQEEARPTEAGKQRQDFKQEVQKIVDERRELSQRLAQERGITTVVMGDFETGKPVEFESMRKTEAAPILGTQFQQDIEPIGIYMLKENVIVSSDKTQGWETETVKFENPLVLPFNTQDFHTYDGTSWKAVLSQAYEGKIGQELTDAIIADGYDGIVTVDVAEGKAVATREIVQLPKAESQSGRVKVETERTELKAKREELAPMAKVSEEIGGLEEEYGVEGIAEHYKELSPETVKWIETEGIDALPKLRETIAKAQAEILDKESKLPLTRAKLTEQITTNFPNFTSEETEAALTLVDKFAESKGMTTEEWVGKHLAGITQEKALAEALFQNPAPSVDSAEFKKWFGESKIVDENGNPLKVYHGTSAVFDTYDIGELGKGMGNTGWFGAGFYFTPDQEMADMYGAIVMDLYLKVETPFVIVDLSSEERSGVFLQRQHAFFMDTFKQFPEMIKIYNDREAKATIGDVMWNEVIEQYGSERLSKELQVQGYDGVIKKRIYPDSAFFNDKPRYAADNIADAPGHTDEIVVFEPTQIKSVRNQGTWDISDPNIYHQLDQLGGEAYKGAVSFLEDGRALIHATEASDFSTFVHEMGHIFTRQTTGEDMKALKEWCGLEENQDWTREALEKIAEGWEQYLQSGEAPSSQLRAIFEKFMEWLANIWDRIKASHLPERVKVAYAHWLNVANPDFTLEYETTKVGIEERAGIAEDMENTDLAAKMRTGEATVEELVGEVSEKEIASDEMTDQEIQDVINLGFQDFINEEIDQMVEEAQAYQREHPVNFDLPFTEEEMPPNKLAEFLELLYSQGYKGKGYSPIVIGYMRSVHKFGFFREGQYEKALKYINQRPEKYRMAMQYGEIDDVQREADVKAAILEEFREQAQAIIRGKVDPKAVLRDALKSARQEARLQTKQATQQATQEVTETLKSARQESALQSAEAKKRHNDAVATWKEALLSARKEATLQVRRVRAEARAVSAKRREKAYVKKLGRLIAKDVPESVNYFYKQAIEALTAGIDPRFRSEKTLREKEQRRLFLEGIPDKQAELAKLQKIEKPLPKQIARMEKLEHQLASVTDMPVSLIRQLDQTPVNLMTVNQLEDVYKKKKLLIKLGREKQKRHIADKARRFEDAKTANIAAIRSKQKGGADTEGPRQHGTQAEKPTNKLKWAWVYTLRPPRWLDKIDGGAKFNGPNHRYFYDAATEVRQKELRQVAAWSEAFHAKRKELGLREAAFAEHKITIKDVKYNTSDAMAVYGDQKNEKNAIALRWGNKLSEDQQQKIIDTLSVKEKAMMDWMMEWYRDIAPEIREFHINFTNKEFGYEEWYTPMVRADWDRDIKEPQIADQLLHEAGLRRAYVEHGFSIKRKDIPEKYQTAIRLDAIGTMFDQFNRVAHYMHGAETVEAMQRMANNFEYKAAVREVYGSEYVLAVRDFANVIGDPNIYRASDWFARALKAVRRNTAMAYLAFNVATMAKQLPSLLLYVPYSGVSSLVKSAFTLATHWKDAVQFIHDRDAEMANRSIERELEEFKVRQKTAYGQLVAKVGTKGMWGIMFLDKLATHIGWRAVYDNAKARGMSEAEAIREAHNVTLRTQPAADAKDLAQLYTKLPALQLLTQFTNQLNQIWNIMTYDMPQAFKQGDPEQGFAHIASLALVAVAIWSIQNGRLPEDEEELSEAFIIQLLNSIPIFGKAVASPWPSEVPAIKAVGNIYRGAGELAEKGTVKKSFLEGLSVIFAWPYTGTRRVVEAMTEGDIRKLFGFRTKRRK